MPGETGARLSTACLKFRYLPKNVRISSTMTRTGSRQPPEQHPPRLFLYICCLLSGDLAPFLFYVFSIPPREPAINRRRGGSEVSNSAGSENTGSINTDYLQARLSYPACFPRQTGFAFPFSCVFIVSGRAGFICSLPPPLTHLHHPLFPFGTAQTKTSRRYRQEACCFYAAMVSNAGITNGYPPF